MTTLAEIEAAVEALPPDQKQQLLLFLTAGMRAQGVPLPRPHKFSSAQINKWIVQDESDMRRFREGE
ncbi:MAG TPA: hypothetical protein VFE58_00175 [Tepidisphaeraceae bacterium]|jgi:hypothetical protein|nr:hypothetical protein [Tepidisphaeraceae bacterium]